MIKEKAYAKINLFLNVISKRIDGFHDLEMVMASIDLFDVLSFKLLETKDIIVESNILITKNIEDNLVHKIAIFLQREFDVSKGVHITIEKEIPIEAGLAGGSADAAATLRGLNKLWKLGLPLEDLAKIGSEFGSDIPFCIHNKLCVARGKGEDLFFLDKKVNCPILIVNPNIRISTKEVFNRLEEKDIYPRKISDMTAGIYNRNAELICRELYNSLEKVAFEMEPLIRDIKNQMLDTGLQGALMSGSGATVFGISKDKNILKKAYELFNDKYYKRLTKIR